LDSWQVPSPPTDAALNTFNARFTSHIELLALVDTIFNEAPNTTIQLARWCAYRTSQTGTHALNTHHVKEHNLSTMFTMVAVYGLRLWCPDVCGDPTSLYNAAHEMIAIRSFQIVAGAAHGYSFMKVDTTHLQNTHLLTKMYQNLVFSSERAKVDMEAKRPGSLKLKKSNTDRYKRRQRVCV